MSTCSPNPPPPDGYRIWRGAPPPVPLTQWAVDLRDHWMPKVNYGDTTGFDYNGAFVVARKDHHTWTYRKGKLLTGICIPGITLYQSLLTPALAGVPSSAIVGAGDATYDPSTDTLVTPDPTVAAYNHEPGTDWGLVALSGGAVVVVVGAFLAGLHFAGHVEEDTKKRLRRAA